MTEHIAHLDSPNIDHLAVLMHALADRVQFVLATPANAESCGCPGATSSSPSCPATPAAPTAHRSAC